LVLDNVTQKRSLGCARIFSEASWLSTIEYLPHSSEVWRYIHSIQLLLSTRNVTLGWGHYATYNKLYGKMCSFKHRVQS